MRIKLLRDLPIVSANDGLGLTKGREFDVVRDEKMFGNTMYYIICDTGEEVGLHPKDFTFVPHRKDSA